MNTTSLPTQASVASTSTTEPPSPCRNQAPKTDRLNQVPSWEFRNCRKPFTPPQLAKNPVGLCVPLLG